MGAVKSAIMEVQDAVANCIETGLTLEDTIQYCNDLYKDEDKIVANSYLIDARLIKQIYEEWRGGEL